MVQKMKKNKIQTDEGLNKLFDALGQEIVYAQIYYKLFRELVESIPEYEHEFQESNTFWTLTLDSLRKAWHTQMCRIFDQTRSSLNLLSFLKIIKANQYLFDEVHFRRRLGDNAPADLVVELFLALREQQLDKDILSVSCKNPLVEKLWRQRNSIVAHLDPMVLLGESRVLEENPLSKTEIEILLDLSLAIINRYSNLYRSSEWSRQIIGHEDYQWLLKLFRLGLQRFHDDRFGKDSL